MKIKYYFLSGIMIAFGIAFSLSSVIHLTLLNESSLYVFGIIFGGIFIGVGLLPFEMRKEG